MTGEEFYKKQLLNDEWEELTTRLKNSGHDLSKILITAEAEETDDTRTSKRDS